MKTSADEVLTRDMTSNNPPSALHAPPPGNDAIERQARWRQRCRTLAIGLIFLVIVVGALFEGMKLRERTWAQSEPIRHRYDIRNNLLFGRRAINEGVMNLYGNVLNETSDGNYHLDYVPLRLLTMRLWAGWVNANYDDRIAWQEEIAFTRPLLYFNAALELFSAVAIFILVRMWIRRSDRAEMPQRDPGKPPAQAPPPPSNRWRGAFAGLVAAMIFWFSPAVHISAHGWPSWDIWIIPFYLYAVLFGCVNRWFVSGVILGVGTMFKGQQLMVAPLLLLWPLFMGRWDGMLKWLSGYLFTATLIVAPWLLRFPDTREMNGAAVAWIACVLVAGILLLLVRALTKRGWRFAIAGGAALMLLLWPWSREAAAAPIWMGIALAAIAVGLARALPWREHRFLIPGIVGAALAMCPFLFSSDLTWFELSFKYGSEKFSGLEHWGANTLPTLLGRHFGWRTLQDVVYTIEPRALLIWPAHPIEIPLRLFLVGTYSIALVLLAAAMARHTLRGDRHFLVAMAAIWLVAFAVMPQMHGRYLLFGTAIGAVFVGVGMGLVLLNVVLTILSWMMTVHLMIGAQRDRREVFLRYLVPDGWAGSVQEFIFRAHPGIAWLILLATAIILFVALTPSSRSRAPGLRP